MRTNKMFAYCSSLPYKIKNDGKLEVWLLRYTFGPSGVLALPLGVAALPQDFYGKINLLVLMGGWAEGQACTDPGLRTPIGVNGILFYEYSIIYTASIVQP
jgi:hypothetical protein